MKKFMNIQLMYFMFLFDLITANNVLPIVKLDTWMKDLAPHIRDMPLNTIAIPGSHDSMTYSIPLVGSKLGPDAETGLSFINQFFPYVLINWSKTQVLNTMNQLLKGIRFFDLRVATKPGTNSIFYTHALYAGLIIPSMVEIKEFVDSHAGEVVILDFQRFYGFEADDHERLIDYLLSWFGDRLVPQPHGHNLQNITLNMLTNLKQSIILVYRESQAYGHNNLWVSHFLPSPWHHQVTTTGILESFRNLYRSPRVFFVHQAVITPTAGFAATRFWSSLLQKCAKPVLKDVIPVIASHYSPGPVKNDKRPVPINVVIADFVHLDNNLFPRTIIAMNNKLHPPSTLNETYY